MASTYILYHYLLYNHNFRQGIVLQIVTINVLYLIGGSLIDNRCCGFFCMTQWLAALHISNIYNQSVSHVVVEASLCFPHLFFITYICIPYGWWVYIAVDTILYLYTLPIDSFLTLNSSLCLSCNLSQSWGYNTNGFISCFTDIHLVLDILWKYIRIHFTYDSQLLHLTFFLCTISQYLI